mmetsp:Transcript_42111/g.101578  ORF Transcript_42111/g.101578 Transcript_42111/m.101578 type:complete len:105 (+) Transcript_42111:3185-3499(+)
MNRDDKKGNSATLATPSDYVSKRCSLSLRSIGGFHSLLRNSVKYKRSSSEMGLSKDCVEQYDVNRHLIRKRIVIPQSYTQDALQEISTVIGDLRPVGSALGMSA